MTAGARRRWRENSFERRAVFPYHRHRAARSSRADRGLAMSVRQPRLWLLVLLAVAPAVTARAAEDFAGGVPDAEAVTRATRLIKQTFATEYGSATTFAGRAALAQRLLKEAVDTKDESAARYVLLCEARDF